MKAFLGSAAELPSDSEEAGDGIGKVVRCEERVAILGLKGRIAEERAREWTIIFLWFGVVNGVRTFLQQ